MQDQGNKNIEFVQEAYKNYKANENNKIVQFLHITVLIILGALSKCNRDDVFAIYLIIALLFMPVAYGFFYLFDFYGTTVHVYASIYARALINNQKISIQDESDYSKYSFYHKTSRNLCVACIALSYGFLLIGLISMFPRALMTFDFMTSCIVLTCFILIYLGMQFVKRFPW